MTIIVNVTVEKILFSTPNEAQPRAIGIEMAISSSSPKYRVAANSEVILCAGAIGSPHLLFVSGIGCSDELDEVAIPVVKNIPAVGKHLLDVSRMAIP